MSSALTDFLDAPKGDTSKIACFLDGGRFNGDRGSIGAPAPDVIYVVACDCGAPSQFGAVALPEGSSWCGSFTHWHTLAEMDELGDAPRHGEFYVLVKTQPAPSGMRAALYASAGHERPTRAEIARARNSFDRRVRSLAARTQPRGNTTDPQEGHQ